MLAGTLAPLEYSRYRTLWSGALAYGLAQLIQSIAAAWTVFEITRSPLWVGIVTAAPLLPVPLISPIAGAIADRMDRRVVLMAATAGMAVTSVVIVVLFANSLLSPLILTALMLGVGVGIAFIDPTWQTIIPDVVPARLLVKAVTLSAATTSAVWAFGTALAGIMLPTLGAHWVFSASVVGYVTMFIAAATLGRLPTRSKSIPPVHTLVMTAVRHVRFSRHLRGILFIVVWFGVTGVSLQALLPSVAGETLGDDTGFYGALVAGFGLGAFVAILARVPVARRLGSRIVATAMMGFGLSALAVALSDNVVSSVLAMVVAGAMWTWVLATLSGTLQMLTPAWIRGRVIALYVVTLLGSMTLGSILAGISGEVAGSMQALVLWSSGVVVVGAAASRRALPDVDRIKKDDPAGPRLTGAPAWVTTGTVMVITVWQLGERDQAELVDAARRLRAIRMRTGALTWHFYRSADRRDEFVEVMHVYDWSEYQRMTERLTIDAVGHITAASALDARGAPHRGQYVELQVPADV